jgi:hypothetical protein
VKLDKLLSLDTDALIELADKMGLYLPPGLERVFIMEELCAALEEESAEKRSPEDEMLASEGARFSSSEDELPISGCEEPCLESRYNETKIYALLRDPSWAYSYWDISDADRKSLQAEEDFSHFFLRVYVLPHDGESIGSAQEFYDIRVGNEDMEWYVNLPAQGGAYCFDLCCALGGGTKLLSRSNILHAPRARTSCGREELPDNTRILMELSGYRFALPEAFSMASPYRILEADGE